MRKKDPSASPVEKQGAPGFEGRDVGFAKAVTERTQDTDPIKKAQHNPAKTALVTPRVIQMYKRQTIERIADAENSGTF